ncbi:ubiquitin-like domain-containing CTD phosphatase 1 [Entomortierella parvispora]|uniref:protein-serine/threonine phosphatase n=1 Tax=Entomortierella parvispora TaxID=205924 RepID=A0A9P3HHP2_9FUNG|nr:ubiquitin-like domain-containing CTD phosphatase 1 [Entomortierella parvispora]
MISNQSAGVNSTTDSVMPETAAVDTQTVVETNKESMTASMPSKASVSTKTTEPMDHVEEDRTGKPGGLAIGLPSDAFSEPSLSTSNPVTSCSSLLNAAPSTAMETTEAATEVEQLNQNNKRVISLTAQWNGKKLPFEVDLDYTIGELKNKLMELTNVEPKRQKLMLVRGKLPEDHVVLSSLSLKDNQTFLMMGTPEAKVIKAPETMPDVLNDLDEDYTPDDEAFASMAANQKNLKAAIAKCDINIMHTLRPGKKLLVLDLDYTLIDCKALNNPMIEVMRPGLHEFLSVCYEHYDIVIWSQTSWRALEAKVTTIGLLTHPEYKISFVMDISTMFSVMSQRDGKPFKHQVKALDIIWTKFPQYSAKNTIHIDDLSRNFAMNPKSGLKIGAFKNGAVSRHVDRELYHLAKYLIDLSKNTNFKEIDHKVWKNHRKLSR